MVNSRCKASSRNVFTFYIIFNGYDNNNSSQKSLSGPFNIQVIVFLSQFPQFIKRCTSSLSQNTAIRIVRQYVKASREMKKKTFLIMTTAVAVKQQANKHLMDNSYNFTSLVSVITQRSTRSSGY